MPKHILPFITLFALLFAKAWAKETHAFDSHTDALNTLQNMLPVSGTLTNSPYIESYRPYGNGILPQFETSNEVAGGKVLQVDVRKRASNVWAKGINVPITKRVRRDDVLLAAITMRCLRERCKSIPIGFQQNGAPYRDVRRLDVTPRSEWTTFYIKAVADAGFAADKIQVSFHLGEFKGGIELGPTFVLNMGQQIPLFELPGD